MKIRDYILSAILLLLIGITLGTLFTMYTTEDTEPSLARVELTEIKKSDQPFIPDESLASIDTRFLFRKIADEVTPTVVYIESIIPIGENMPNDENHEQGDNLWDRILPRTRRARTVGSGIIISTDGYILTNNHVVEDAVRDGINVVLLDKREYPARIVGKDPSTDLAVIKIDASGLKSITVGNSNGVDVGEWVLAIGNPFRLRSTVTAGIVSALSRDVQIINDRLRIESFIQTDAAINKGNSGGALVNTSGQLIGVNTAIASQSGTYQGYGFAVPSNLAMKVATDIIQYGTVRRAMLGVSIASVDFQRAQDLGMPEVTGVEILSTSEGGAAEEFGLQAGDVVLKVNDISVDESNQLQEKVAVMKPGEYVKLNIWRDGEQFVKNVQLKELQPEPVAELEIEEEPIEIDEIPLENNEKERGGIGFYKFDIGFSVMAVATPEDPAAYDMVVNEVDKYSEAWNRGLQKGQQIIEVDETKVEDLQSLQDLITQGLKANDAVTLTILTEDGAKGYIQLKK